MRTKKKYSALCVVLAVLLFAMVLIGCREGSNNNENTLKSIEGDEMLTLDPKIETRIKQEWQELFGRPLFAYSYYGTHNGFVVFPVFGTEDIVIKFKVADTIFRWNSQVTIWLWKDGNFQTMIEGYQQGLISQKSIAEIGSYHIDFVRKSWPGDDESFYEWYFNADDISQIIE